VAVYHCQQAAEKALKGFLVYHGLRPEKTHDLGLLIERAMEIEPGFGSWQDAADRLTPFATAYRSPGILDQPNPEDYEEAIDDSETIVKQVLAFLPPGLHPGLGVEL
jgi:HEPN domain-containing protein